MTRRESADRPLVRWLAPGLSIVLACAFLVAGLIGKSTWFAWFGFAVMSVFALLLLVLADASETVAGLLSRRDERINSLDRDATLFAGTVVMASVLVMFVVEIARGADGSPYYQLAAIGGVAYLAALIVLRLRR